MLLPNTFTYNLQQCAFKSDWTKLLNSNTRERFRTMVTLWRGDLKISTHRGTEHATTLPRPILLLMARRSKDQHRPGFDSCYPQPSFAKWHWKNEHNNKMHLLAVIFVVCLFSQTILLQTKALTTAEPQMTTKSFPKHSVSNTRSRIRLRLKPIQAGASTPPKLMMHIAYFPPPISKKFINFPFIFAKFINFPRYLRKSKILLFILRFLCIMLYVYWTPLNAGFIL